MAARHISPEERIRREVVRFNFQDLEMRRLGESEGSIEDIRKRATELAPDVQASGIDPLSVEESEGRTREERNALFIIDAIDRLARVQRKLEEEAARRPVRSPEEMDGVTPLTRATLEDGRDNF
ncbi:MAG: hypothetical protein ABWX90_03915 [Candidatus Saccharimonadales bacterium]